MPPARLRRPAATGIGKGPDDGDGARMKQARALAMFLFDTYSEMADEDQASALATLQTVDPTVHDALVQLLVADALAHDLDVPPWLGVAIPALTAEDTAQDTPAPPDDGCR